MGWVWDDPSQRDLLNDTVECNWWSVLRNRRHERSFVDAIDECDDGSQGRRWCRPGGLLDRGKGWWRGCWRRDRI